MWSNTVESCYKVLPIDKVSVKCWLKYWYNTYLALLFIQVNILLKLVCQMESRLSEERWVGPDWGQAWKLAWRTPPVTERTVLVVVLGPLVVTLRLVVERTHITYFLCLFLRLFQVFVQAEISSQTQCECENIIVRFFHSNLELETFEVIMIQTMFLNVLSLLALMWEIFKDLLLTLTIVAMVGGPQAKLTFPGKFTSTIKICLMVTIMVPLIFPEIILNNEGKFSMEIFFIPLLSSELPTASSTTKTTAP